MVASIEGIALSTNSTAFPLTIATAHAMTSATLPVTCSMQFILQLTELVAVAIVHRPAFAGQRNTPRNSVCRLSGSISGNSGSSLR